ncbi:MAG: long-chain fatty acid--CoA ligase, partial [Acidobacteriota bacterium]
AEHLLDRFGAEPVGTALGPAGFDIDAAQRWARALDRPGFVVTTAFALAWWLDELESRGRRLRLPSDTRIFETGGFKGRVREVSRADLVARVHDRLGVPPERIIREYGMSELTGHFYSAVLEGGDPDLFRVPHFMRVRTLDPTTLDDVPPGEPGLLAILDLANVGSAMSVLSEDVGLLEDGGFRLLGRARDAELRGCSLTVDELRP